MIGSAPLINGLGWDWVKPLGLSLSKTWAKLLSNRVGSTIFRPFC